MGLTNIIVTAVAGMVLNGSPAISSEYQNSFYSLSAQKTFKTFCLHSELNNLSYNPKTIQSNVKSSSSPVDKYIKRIDYELSNILEGKGSFESAWQIALESRNSGSNQALYHFRDGVQGLLNFSSEAHTYFQASEALIEDMENFKEILDLFKDPAYGLNFNLSMRKKKVFDFSTISCDIVVNVQSKEFILRYWDFSVAKDFAVNHLKECESLSSEDQENLNSLVCVLYVYRAEIAVKSFEESENSGMASLTMIYGLPKMKTDPYQDIIKMLNMPTSSRRAIEIAEKVFRHLQNPSIVSTVATARGLDESEIESSLEKIKARIDYLKGFMQSRPKD